MIKKRQEKNIRPRLTRSLELLLWSYHRPLGSWQNSLVVKLLQAMLAHCLFPWVNTNLIFFFFRDCIIFAYVLTVWPMYSLQQPHLPLRTDCLSFSQSQFSVSNPSLYLKDRKLSLRSLNSGAVVDGSTPKNCLYLFIFWVRLTLPWRFVSNPAYERPAERISMSVKIWTSL